MTDKLVRKDFQEALYERLLPEGRLDLTQRESKLVIDEMFAQLAQIMIEGHPFVIRKVGRMVPYLKVGGRPVRNPRTGESMPMPDRIVVTLSNGNSITKKDPRVEKPRMNNSDFIKRLADRLGQLRIERAKEIAEEAVTLMHEMMQSALENEQTIEIRDLGSFRFAMKTRDYVRNPKTNTTINSDKEYPRVNFRESRFLRKALDKKLKGA